MSTYAYGVESVHSAGGYIENQEKRQLVIEKRKKRMLALKRDELAGIRFSVVLTAQWEASDTLPPARRAILRTELSSLRAEYLDKLDEIAMACGVQMAIATREEVESTVAIPADMTPSVMPMEWDQLYL